MAPLPVIPDVFRCALSTRSAQQYAVNVLHVQSLTSSVADVASDMATILKAASSPYRALMSNSAVQFELAVTPLDGVTATLIVPMGTDGVGLQAGEPVPQAAGILSIRTSRRGPAYRGRQYLPFVGENAISAGAVVSTIFATANASLNTWLGLLPPQDLTLGVASYVHAEFSPISDAIIELQTGTQRRRQDRNRVTS